MKLQTFAVTLLALIPAAFAAFGVSSSGSNLLVDSGAGLVTTSEKNSPLEPFSH